ncbi:hypothetical protein KU854_02260 [Enterovibrio sp. NIFS-20-8]|nr:hypothetical protein [Enterovibrio paralichthyis]
MSMRRIAYSAPSGFVAETRLIDGVYVVERRALRDRRKFSARHRGYERRNSADRRDCPVIDEFI